MIWESNYEDSHDYKNTKLKPKNSRNPREYWGSIYAQLVRHDTEYMERILDTFIQIGRSKKLNELEFAEGAIWANVWGADYILKIDPATGKSLGIINLHTIVAKHNSRPGHTVLNGIAYDEKRKAFWITGKFWPKQYLVKFKEQD